MNQTSMVRTEKYAVAFPRRGSILDANELNAVCDLLADNAPLSAGEWRDRFEEKFRQHIGSRYALSVTSGTTALEIGIRLLDLRPGDEVIATCQTFQASIQPLLDLGVRVRFCDIDAETANIDPDAIAGLITPDTKALILVHYGGNPADMDQICTIAHQHGLLVLEDCAHAIGASYRGRKPGSLGDIGCFSFHSSKNITTLGEGGMITFDRDEWAERADRIRSNEVDAVLGPPGSALGLPPSALPWMKFADGAYRHSYTQILGSGTNAVLCEPACVAGIVQLDKLDGFVARRRMIAARLDEVLAAHPELVRLPAVDPRDEHAYHLYTFFVRTGEEARYRLIRALDEQGVEVQLRYFPLHLTPEWQSRGHRPGECPVAERLWFSEHMNLPCHPSLSDEQVELMCAALENSLNHLR
ncbi:DegT/DnrJ/EryC1/StrS family aminotransferase [Nocardia sp. NPDC020380]|uniref:DegT/DnrJ/EryC1/StrS family aminotransferase n=1 Tax=Nocardia sp. NPDC020380 TaxID=3364309 RepID=UPI0037B9C7D9